MENFNFKLEIIKIKCENGELVEMINKMKFENFKELIRLMSLILILKWKILNLDWKWLIYVRI